MNLWSYQGLEFPDKKSLREYFGFSTCKFEMKVKDKEIVKLTQQATANEKLHGYADKSSK